MAGAQARKLGQLIAAARQREGLSFRELGEMTGLDYVWILRFERGDYVDPAPDRLTRLAEALDIDPERINRITKGQMSDRLPAMRTYFRAKYDLTAEEINEVETFVRELRDKGGDHDDSNDN